MKQKKTPESRSINLLRQLFVQGKRIFGISEAAATAAKENVLSSQLNKILSNLAKRGLIIRLRRGLYATVGLLGEQAFPHPFAIATHLVQPSAISHWTALQYHGLTEQVPQIITASTTSKVITPSMRKKPIKYTIKKHHWEIEGVKYEYITVQKKHFFGIEKIWLDENFQIPITDKERTLLDAIIYVKMFGGLGAIVEIIETALPDLDISKLINYTIQYGKPSLAKRLGWILEYLGVEKKNLLPLLLVKIKYYCRLDPSQPPKGPCDSHWMIQNNITNK